MSLSTLQAQLAALNDAGSGAAGVATAGSSIPSNRRHEESIGRGLHFSVQHGQAVRDSTNNKFRASLLYATAREAADVPTRTIRAQALESLQRLSTLDKYHPGLLRELAHVWAQHKEDQYTDADAGVKSEQEDRSRTGILTLVSSILLECDSTNSTLFSDALNLVEYMLRYYQLHVIAGPDLLWALLPVSDRFPALVNRALLLVDWTDSVEKQTSYLWLRPYCVQSSTVQVPPRWLLAHQSVQHVNLLKKVCQMARQFVDLHEQEQSVHPLPRRGCAHGLSFTAALIVEGLAHVVQSKDKDDQAREAIVRTLLPHVLAAVHTKNRSNPDWTAWGYIVASAFAESMPLSKPTISLLCNNIIQGVLAENNDDNDHDEANLSAGLERQADAVACVLSILLPKNSWQENVSSNSRNVNYLELLHDRLLGCPLPDDDSVKRSTYATLLRLHRSLPAIFAHLYNDRHVVVAPLVATLMVRELRHAESGVSHAGMKQKKSSKSKGPSSLIIDLLQQPDLSLLWKDPRTDLIASVAALLVETTKNRGGAVSSGKKSSQNDLEYRRRILHALHRHDKQACERGIAAGIHRVAALRDEMEGDDENESMDVDTDGHDVGSTSAAARESLTESLRPLLEGIVPLGKMETDKTKGSDDANELLPPRMAMEHSNPTVRLDAIQRLVDSILCEEESSAAAVDLDLWLGLSRRWASDRDSRVALSACEALCTWFEQDQVSPLQETDAAKMVIELALTACHRWINTSSSDSDNKYNGDELLVFSLRALAYTAREVARLGNASLAQLWVKSLVVLVPFLSDSDETLVKEADQCVVLALDLQQQENQRSSSRKKTVRSAATTLLIESPPFLSGLQTLFGDYQNANKKMNDRKLSDASNCQVSVMLVMDALHEAMTADSEADDGEVESIAEDALKLGLMVVAMPSNASSLCQLTEAECEIVRRCLEESIKTHPVADVRVPGMILALAAALSQTIWSQIAQPILQLLVKGAQDRFKKGRLPLVTVLWEAVLRAGVENQVALRLLEQIEAVLVEECRAPWLSVVPALALLESSCSPELRAGSVGLLCRIGTLLPETASSKRKTAGLDWSCLKAICRHISSMGNSAKIGGESFLPAFLSSCMRESANLSSSIQKVLLSLCVFSSSSCGDESIVRVVDLTQKSWLSLGTASGGTRAASILLCAMEAAGEDAFPLQVRWKFAGQPLLDALLLCTEDPNDDLRTLAKCLGRMLKAVTVTNPRIVIHSGPKAGSGGRARSYSVGKMDGTNYLNPYPDEMRKALVEVLLASDKSSVGAALASFVCEGILKSTSWTKYVFKNLPTAAKQEVAAAVLDYASSDEAANAPEDILLGLPLAAADIVHLMKASVTDLAAESTLVEYIRVNGTLLAADADILALVSLVFEHLMILCSSGDDDKDAKDFITRSALVALSKIFKSLSFSSNGVNANETKLNSWANNLLALLGSAPGTQGQSLTTYRSRSACLSLMVSLVSNYPKQTASFLVPAITTVVVPAELARSSGRNARDTFSKLVPSFLKHGAMAGITFTDLLLAFVASVDKLLDQNDREQMFRDLVEATTVDDGHWSGDEPPIEHACVGAIQAFFLAAEVYNGGRTSGKTEVSNGAVGFAVELLEQAPVTAQATSLLLLLSYAKELLLQFQDDHMETDNEVSHAAAGLLPSFDQIGVVAATGECKDSVSSELAKCLGSIVGRKSIRALIIAILQVFSDGLMLDTVKKFIRRGDPVVSRLSLQLWQNLLLVQSALQVPVATEYCDGDSSEQFQASVSNIASESREYLQGILPAHTFLASVSSLIKTGGTNEIRARALRLVADRIADLDSRSPEAALFEDVLPIALEILDIEKHDKAFDLCNDLVLVQSALVAIEHIARAFDARKSEAEDSRCTLGLKYFVSALGRITDAVVFCDKEIAKKTHSSAYHDLISSLALCGATLVRVVGAPCLPVLPKFVKSMLSILSVANDQLLFPNSITHIEELSLSRVMQLSIMRALVAVIETVPQFIPPFLPDLLSSVVLSSKLREAGDDAASIITQRFDAAMASHVAPRLLIPAASKALAACTHPEDIRVLLCILKSSTEQASSSTVNALKPALLNSVTWAFDYEPLVGDRAILMEAACDLLEAFVLKLSEVQLRRIFDSMIDWRGALDFNNLEHSAHRRIAFWTMTERLSKELRSLFLPCLIIVTDDLIAELKRAVATMGGKSSRKNSVGTKKRKLEPAPQTDYCTSPEAMGVLLPILATLEHCLRADAYQGGSWIRAEENRKYEDLLEPLGKLLRARVPENFPLPSTAMNDPYVAVVVEGPNGGGDGSVVRCLAALGAAGGNEQLWKPLNHAVLKACGDEHRCEVRRAGLVCLLELMKSLGEEYMVLLPENLPVLAELLEDTNEEVASLARQVVTLAEELTGESLEDSLR